jgi:metal-responsive CopG/Arc/MetJ family transcriptional regulator
MDMKTAAKNEEKMDRISVRIPADLKQRLETAAKAGGVSMTDIIRAALEAAVENQPATPANFNVFD